MSIDLDAIQARADNATEGPWKTTRHDLSLYVQSRYANLQANLGYVGNHPEADAEFIAHARTDVPALLAYARDLEARLGRVDDLVGWLDAAGADDETLYSKGKISARGTAARLRAALTATEGQA